VRLAWRAVPGSTGYQVYWREATQPYGNTSDGVMAAADADGIVRHVVRDLSLDRPYYFAVTSYDADDVESPFSNELLLKPPLVCAAAPIPGCRAPTAPGKAVLSVRNGAGTTRDRLGWKWAKGPEVSPTDLGYPPGDTSYILCVYDEAQGVSILALSIRLPAGGLCGNDRPCWRENGRRGFAYVNRSPPGGGFLQAKLKHGAAGKAMVRVSGGGESLSLPNPAPDSLFEQDPAVTVQLVNDAIPSVCWEASYSPEARVHTAIRFKDKSD
jgi:hypothetical protein